MTVEPLSWNRCDQPSWLIASPRFNRHPIPLEIQGVRRTHRSFFSRLEGIPDPAGRERAFRSYADLLFREGNRGKNAASMGRRTPRNGYLRFLRGWMLDASSAEGAVLKGWVESRFGLPPVFHAGRIEGTDTREYLLYLAERMRESTGTNAVEAQFDLLYEYVQSELRRRHPGVSSFRLFRGVRDLAEYQVVANPGTNRPVVRLNNLNSFSCRLEHAWQFGGHVFEADVPAAKIFFRADLLPGVLPAGEEEALVIGGDFEVTVRNY